MKLTFLGTRGEIDGHTRRHGKHSALLVAYRQRRVMIDCGEDWAGCVHDLRPQAIVLTHAHPDHAWGLEEGAPCPVYATAETWQDIEAYPIQQRHTLAPREPSTVAGITFEAFPVEHSTRCPAVGYRVYGGRVVAFYVPDVVYIHGREAALEGTKLYVGDGATLARPLVRKRGERLIGHTPVRTQLTWCGKAGVGRALFTHCGSQIVDGDERSLGAQVRHWGQERGVEAGIAHDGMEVVLR